MAEALEKNQERLIKENRKDLAAGQKARLSSALMDRLRLTLRSSAGWPRGFGK